MQTIWTQDEASYDGELVSFQRIWSWPEPAQRPHPPILVGSNGRAGARGRSTRTGEDSPPRSLDAMVE